MFIRFTASAFRKLLSIYVFSYFPFGFGRMWDLIVSVPDHCLSFYFVSNCLVEMNITFVFPVFNSIQFCLHHFCRIVNDFCKLDLNISISACIS